LQSAVDAAFGEFRAVDKLLSIHRKDSELSVLNKAASAGFGVASPELFEALLTAQQFTKQTNGAFDPTIRPLTELWGFIKKTAYRMPTKIERQTALSKVGWGKIDLNIPERTVRFTSPDMSIDPGGFGKGMAVDKAIMRLDALGIKNAMVKAGGDLRVLGLPPHKNHWAIQIEDPKKQGKRVTVTLRKGAMSTSGNYENFFKANGKIYSHILNPRTGLPIQGMASCTVTAPSCVETDTLATACFVLGVTESLKRFSTKIGMRFVTFDKKKMSVFKSKSFPASQ